MILLILSVAFMPIFAFWMHRQEKKGKPALIPNSLWKKRTFTSICLMVLLSIALISGIELFSSLLYVSLPICLELFLIYDCSFQEVQGLSALETSIRFFPGVVVGILSRFTIGLFIDKVPAVYIVVASCVLCSGAPLLMAFINPAWPYWYDAFVAQVSSILVSYEFTLILAVGPGTSVGRCLVHSWNSHHFRCFPIRSASPCGCGIQRVRSAWSECRAMFTSSHICRCHQRFTISTEDVPEGFDGRV